MSERLTINVTVNGTAREAEAETRKTLADFLREDLARTGSPSSRTVQARGASITTIEGLADGDDLNPLQSALRDSHAFQCGFCTPGFVMQITALLQENPSPTEAEVRETLSGNLCRCTGYETIINGVLSAAGREGAIS